MCGARVAAVACFGPSVVALSVSLLCGVVGASCLGLLVAGAAWAWVLHVWCLVHCGRRCAGVGWWVTFGGLVPGRLVLLVCVGATASAAGSVR